MDTVDKATRSRIMRAIKSKNTKPELALLAMLRRRVTGWSRRGKGLPGTPDFVFKDVKLAVFVHGCFWHLCRRHYKAPKAGAAWLEHMDRNRRRDIRVRRRLRRLGWATMVVWEHEDMDKAATRVAVRRQHLRHLALCHVGEPQTGLQMGRY